jgi:hypothetical protein
MDPTLFPFLFGEGFGGGAGAPPPAPAPFPPNPFTGPGFSNPGAMDAALAGAPYQPPGAVAGSVGGNVANAPGPPMSLAPPNPGSMATVPGSTPPPGLAQAQAAGGNLGNALQNAMRGVQAAQPPAPQKVATPHAPQLGKVPPSELINMLSSLGIGPQQAVGLGFGRRF